VPVEYGSLEMWLRYVHMLTCNRSAATPEGLLVYTSPTVGIVR